MRRQASLAFTSTHTHVKKKKKKEEKTVPQTHTNTHTQAASSPHLRNVTGLLLHSKPTGALNKHLFLPVNPPSRRHAAYTALPRRANTLSSLRRSPLLLFPHALVLSMAI